jgi:hypothetical protein
MWQHRSSPLSKAEPRAVGHVTTLELPSQEGRAWSPDTRGNAGAHINKETRSEAEGHVVRPELTLERMRGPGARDTWRLRNPPLQGGVVQSYSVHVSTWIHVLIVVLT